MRYSGAIFDLDGTLLDSMSVWLQIDIDFLGKRGLSVPEDYLDRMLHLNIDEAADYTIKRFGFNESPEDIIKEWNDMAVYAYGNEVQLKPFAGEFLKKLNASRIPMAVATSSTPELYGAVFKNLGLGHYFDYIVTTREVGAGKNRPDVYIEAACRLGLEVSRCVVFEDIYEGMRSAKEAGFYTVVVEDEASLSKKELLQKEADLYVTDFSTFLFGETELF